VLFAGGRAHADLERATDVHLHLGVRDGEGFPG
jgi:hypothetical protein